MTEYLSLFWADPRRYGKTLRVKQVEEYFRRDGVYTVHYVVHEKGFKPLGGAPLYEAEPLKFGPPSDIAERLSRATVGWAPTFPRASIGPRPFSRQDYYDGIVETYPHDSPLNKQMQEWLTRKGAYGSTIKSREA